MRLSSDQKIHTTTLSSNSIKKCYKNILVLFIIIIISSLTLSAQKKSASKPPLNAEPKTNVDNDFIAKLILEGLNKMRIENYSDSLEYNEVLGKASAIQSQIMAEKGKVTLVNSSGKYKTTAKRVTAMGGTKNAEELVLCLSTIENKKQLSPEEIANAAMLKWEKGKKEKIIITNGNYVYASPSVKPDETGKKVYISVVFGSFNTFNPGVKKRKELKVRFTKKNRKIKSSDIKSCKNCVKFKDYEGLSNGLYLEGGKIFLKYDNLKALTKLISKDGDGLAVDIIQRAQYEKPDYNILNTNLMSKGVLSKTVRLGKIISKNRIKPEKKGGKVTKLDVQLGKLPKKLVKDSTFEINLLIIQDGKLCKTIMKSYLEQGDQTSTTTLKMLLCADSIAHSKPFFSPKSDDALLNFTLPFEKNKFEYKEEDITPFLNALQEPDFIIEGLYITAYSSIEGDADANVVLQKKRSQSIIKALANLQKEGVVTEVKTSDSWPLFQMSMEDGKYDTLTKMTKEQAIHEINTKQGLSEELEPFLSKQRFGEIIMDVSYDIRGAKEEKFSISKFNQAVKKDEINLAYKIQCYIDKQIREKKYTANAFRNTEIPNEAKYSGLLNNQVVFHYMSNGNKIEEEDYQVMKKLSVLDPTNNYITFNSILCALKLALPIGDKNEINGVQGRIDALYKSEIPKKYIDALNIEWQFKIIDAMDTVADAQPIIEACIEKVKSFYDLKEASWQNNLKLSYIFARFKDYKYASNLLADFIKQENANEQILFAYISFCAQMPELTKSRLFVTALRKAEKVNHERYCKLFGASYLTFQILDNPFVKEDYNKMKCK